MKTYTQITILFFILLSTKHPLQSQSMSVTTNIETTHYFDILKAGHLHSEYGIGNTFFIKVDFNEIESTGILKNLELRFKKSQVT
jgi:hypothetical protein